ncbi:transposase family protein, partial [Roseiflexus sp.]
MTGRTIDEFKALVPIFHAAFEAHMQHQTIDGRFRWSRRSVSYANSPLPTNEDKLVFILTYVRQNVTQATLGCMFQMSQSNVRMWANVLHTVLNQALG